MKVIRLARRFCSSSVASFHGGEGDVLRKEHRFVQEEVKVYAALSGDSNPIHSLPSAAASAGFSACVVHGMLCSSLFPSLIRSHFPGAFFKSKTLRFKEPALVGDCLEAEVKILSLCPAEDGLRNDRLWLIRRFLVHVFVGGKMEMREGLVCVMARFTAKLKETEKGSLAATFV